MHDLSDLEERVLGVLADRSRLDLEQIAGAARLSAAATQGALQHLVERNLVTISAGPFGALYELNRRMAQRRTAAA